MAAGNGPAAGDAAVRPSLRMLRRFGSSLRTSISTRLVMPAWMCGTSSARTGLKVTSGAKAELVQATDAADFVKSGCGETPEPVASAPEAEEGSADARTLMVDYDHQGVGFKEWRDVESGCL